MATQTDAPSVSAAPPAGAGKSAVASRPRRAARRTLPNGVKSTIGVLTLVLLWEAVVRLFDVPRFLFIAPSAALGELVAQPVYYLEHSAITLYESLLGFALGALLGVACGAVIYYVPFVRHALYPSLIAVNTIPKVALAPLFIVWFGFSMESKVAVALSIAFFPLVIATFDGLASVPSELRELARINRASRFKQMRKIELVHSLPAIFTGMKISISMAVGGAVVGEFIAGNSGLGYVVLVANSQINLASMFAAFICLALMSLLLFVAVEWLGKKLLPWNEAISA